MQQLSGYFLRLKFDPELLFSAQFQYRNRIAMEFNQLYHWHPLMPDSFKVGSQDYSYEQFLFNTSMLVDYGVEALVDAFSRQSAGRVSLCGECGEGRWAVGGDRPGCKSQCCFLFHGAGVLPTFLLPFLSSSSCSFVRSAILGAGDSVASKTKCGSRVLVPLALTP